MSRIKWLAPQNRNATGVSDIFPYPEITIDPATQELTEDQPLVFLVARLYDVDVEFGGTYDGYQITWSYGWSDGLVQPFVAPEWVYLAVGSSFVVYRSVVAYRLYSKVTEADLWVRAVVAKDSQIKETLYSRISFAHVS